MFSKTLFISCLVLFISSCASKKISVPASLSPDPPVVKNVILLIGDGMGLTQLSAGTYAFANTSHFERCKHIGLHKPYAYDALITDSAAGATAFACGEKTYNGAIAVNSDTIPIKTILEEAEERGLSSGLIATSSITHATPASFIAHNRYRKNMEEIAEDFLDTEIDLFIGGGRKHFDSRTKDDRDLLSELRKKDYVISSYFEQELGELDIDPSKNFGYLTSSEEPLRRSEGRDYLPLATDIALNHLSKHGNIGFFLMIEGSQIDWGGHANDLDWVLSEWEEFNDVVGRVLDWAEADGETLVVVTADHETGGLAIQPDSEFGKISAEFTSNYHTGTLIPVYAFGPKAESFGGIYENTAIYNKMKEAFGWATSYATPRRL